MCYTLAVLKEVLISFWCLAFVVCIGLVDAAEADRLHAASEDVFQSPEIRWQHELDGETLHKVDFYQIGEDGSLFAILGTAADKKLLWFDSKGNLLLRNTTSLKSSLAIHSVSVSNRSLIVSRSNGVRGGFTEVIQFSSGVIRHKIYEGRRDFCSSNHPDSFIVIDDNVLSLLKMNF